MCSRLTPSLSNSFSDLDELVDVPTERGGFYFSDWERNFIRSMSDGFDAGLGFSRAQREKIKQIWCDVDLRKRGAPDEKAENLFSKLSPERQAEQRARDCQNPIALGEVG